MEWGLNLPFKDPHAGLSELVKQVCPFQAGDPSRQGDVVARPQDFAFEIDGVRGDDQELVSTRSQADQIVQVCRP
jgi:hypothetical protein